MWDAFEDGPRWSSAGKAAAGSYDHLIDAEREALGRSGRPISKIALIKAFRGASGLGLKESKDAVEDYLRRRGGAIPAGPIGDGPGRWVDDLLDAERAAASKEDRPISKIALIKAFRGASGLGLKESKDAVEDYLRRRGGEGLPDGPGSCAVPVALAAIALVVGVVIYALR